jgi:fatty-acyl-CoA synthase
MDESADFALSPINFLLRSADVWADRPAVVDGARTMTYAEHHRRVRRVAAALEGEWSIGAGDRVATLLPNVAEMLELHYAVPGVGGVLVPLNTRLASDDYAYILGHSGATAVVAYESLRAVLEPALAAIGPHAPRVAWVSPGEPGSWSEIVEGCDPIDLTPVTDERSLLSINYTSGTTGRPKGVMTTHRGAYLHTLGVIAEAGLTTASAYLWTLPMFHCNGWAFTWAVTAAGAAHVAMDKVEAGHVWRSIREHGVTHLCAAPTVLVMLLTAPEAQRCPVPVRVFLGGAPPSPTLLERAAELNIAVTHLYGLTETYGPIAVCAWNPGWDLLPVGEQARLRARQGVATVVSERVRVVDGDMRDVPRDGVTMGEAVMRGNNVMAGYYRDEEATAEAFRGGWFHSGDLAVMHPDGYIEIRDRLKDVVISGGENISTVEVENVLLQHPRVSEAAVVAAPDPKWGEVPVAFVTLDGDEPLSVDDLKAHAAGQLARFKVPKEIHVVDELPKTGTGKIQKFVLRQRAAIS